MTISYVYVSKSKIESQRRGAEPLGYVRLGYIVVNPELTRDVNGKEKKKSTQIERKIRNCLV